MCLTLFLSVIAAISLAVLVLLAAKKNKHAALAILFSAIAIVASFIALALAAPRDIAPNKLGFDYLGIIVAILAVFATLLLGMQLYHVFRVKEDADEVQKAKFQIDNYAKRVEKLTEQAEELTTTIEQLKEKTKGLEEEISPLYDSIGDLEGRLKFAVFTDPNDGPCDDK